MAPHPPGFRPDLGQEQSWLHRQARRLLGRQLRRIVDSQDLSQDAQLSALRERNFEVLATNVLNNKSGMLLWSGTQAASPFHGGTLCLAGPIFRTPIQNSQGSAGPDDCSGGYSFPFTQAYMASHFLMPGTSVYAQYWSRDPGFPIPDNIGLTDALHFVLGQ